MPISKKAKSWLIVAAIPVVLVVGAGIFARLYFTGDRLKALVIPPIEESTHRTVSIGDIALSFIPFGVEIDDLRISNPKGYAFDRDEFVSVGRIRVGVKLLPLLGGKVEIGYVTVDRPRVYLELTAKGEKNYGSGAPGEAASRSTTEKGGVGSLLISNLEINDGEIEQVDRKYDAHMLIEGFALKAGIESDPSAGLLRMKLAPSIDSLSYGSMKMWYLSGQPLTGSLALSYSPGSDVLTFDDAEVKVRALPLKIGGTVSGLTRKVMEMNLDVSSPGAGMQELLSLIPPEMLKSAKGLSSSGEVKFAMTMKGPSGPTDNPGVAGSFTVANGTVKYASLPKTITNVAIAGSFDKPAAPVGATGIGSFSLDRLAATFGTSAIGGNLHVANFDNPHVTAKFAGSLDLGEVHEYYPLDAGTELAGGMKADIAIDGAAKTPSSMKASGTIGFRDVTIRTASSPSPVRNLNGDLTFNNQVITSKKLAMNIGESDLTLGFTLKNYLGLVMEKAAASAGKPSASVVLTSHQLRTADLMPAPAAGAATPAPGAKPAASRSGGMLPGIDLDAVVTVDKLVTDKFTFANAHGDVGISGGVVQLKKMAVDGFDGKITSSGTLDLRDPRKSPFDLNLDVAGVQANALLGNFTSFGKYLFGKFSTSTKIKGDLNDTLGLNTQTLLGNGTVNVADGKLLGFPLTQKLADFTSLSELKEVNFKEWTNAFSIENGRLTVKDLKVSAGSCDILAGGSQGLDGSMDYSLTVRLPAAASDRLKVGGLGGELLQFFKDKEGRINLPLNVSGTGTSPVVRLDARAQEDAAKNALQRKADDAKKKLEDDLKKKAGDQLLKLLKKP